ncbi:MAG: ABC transporter ATP-binding protein [Clostridia bacterium]|nr:ABC transporter ATP-binding protein [Clostridia bacterium]
MPPAMQGRPGGRPGGPHGAILNMEKPKDTFGTLKKLIVYIGRSKYVVFGLLAVMVVTTLLNLAGPALQQKAIDSITIYTEEEAAALIAENPEATPLLNVDFVTLRNMLSLMAIVYIFSAVLSYFQGIYSAKLSQSTVRTMRKDLFSKLERLPIKFFDTHRHGDIMSRISNDTENISMTISQSIGSLFSGVITIVGTFIIMLIYSPLMTLVSMITIPLTLLVTMKLSKFMRRFFKQQQILLGELNSEVEESVNGFKTVIAFSRENKSIEEFSDVSKKLSRAGIKANIFGGVMGPLMNVIGNLGYLLVAAIGGYLAIKTAGTEGAITVGIIQAFLLYSKQFTRPINEIANQYAAIQTAIAGAERVFEILEAEPETDDGGFEISASNITGNLDFNNIVFSYVEGEPVLKDFDLKVSPGQKIAIVGKTGAGKTTVANLLTRFYELDSGEILLDGRNITDITKESLRKNIAIVLQDTVLFSDTIRNNIKYGNENVTDEEIYEAAKNANIASFIEHLPDGYDTVLSEGGGNLSQGQRQLLSIARAFIADPRILILDEATSSVDTRTEVHIQNAFAKLLKGRTSLIIAHRLSTIKDADMIIVVDDGRVAECGSHEQLIEKQGAYYGLYNSQYAGFAT